MGNKYHAINTFSDGYSLTSNATRYITFGNSIAKGIFFSESDTANKIHHPFTLEKFQVRVVTNTKTASDSTVVFRVNAADTSGVCTIPWGITGVFESSTPVNVAADSTCAFAFRYGSSGTGTITWDYCNSLLDFTGLITSYFVNSSSVNNLGTTNPRYNSLLGLNLNSTTEALTQVHISSGRLEGHSCTCISERNGDSTSRVNVDGTGTANTITLNNLQYFENYTNTVDVSGKLLNYEIYTGGTTGNLRLSLQACEIESTIGIVVGENITALSMGSNPFYYFLGGNLSEYSTSDSSSRINIMANYQRCNKIKCNISANNINENTMSIELMKNGIGTGMILTIPQNTTGQFSYDATTADFNEDDEVNYKIYGNGTITTGNLLIRNIVSDWTTFTPVSGTPTYLHFFKLMGV